MIDKFKKIRFKALVMLLAGIIFSIVFQRNLTLERSVYASNMIFMCTMIFIITGLSQLVSNIGLFNSMVFGTKSLFRLFKSKLGPSEQVKEEYVEYVRNRKQYGEIPQLLIIGAVLLGLSVLVSYI
ncbi:MAG: DUF3899 domain-containing protein [Treponema sp.]|nr:DUF3899 domain-containing protein [Treponema sp.]